MQSRTKCIHCVYAVHTLGTKIKSWWRHQMETFSALLGICAGNSPVPGECPAQRPVTRSFDVFFDLRLNKRLSLQSWGWWFETPSRPLWRHRNVQWTENFHKFLCIRVLRPLDAFCYGIERMTASCWFTRCSFLIWTWGPSQYKDVVLPI